MWHTAFSMRAQIAVVYKKIQNGRPLRWRTRGYFPDSTFVTYYPINKAFCKITKPCFSFFVFEVKFDHSTNNFTGCRGTVSSKLGLKADFFMIFHGFCCGKSMGWQKWRLWAIPNFLRPARWQFWQIIPQSYQIRRNFGCVIFLIKDSAAQSQVIGVS